MKLIESWHKMTQPTLDQIEESLAIMHGEALRVHNLSDPLVLEIQDAIKAVRVLNRCRGCGHHRLSCICEIIREAELADLPEGLDPDEQAIQDRVERETEMGRLKC